MSKARFLGKDLNGKSLVSRFCQSAELEGIFQTSTILKTHQNFFVFENIEVKYKHSYGNISVKNKTTYQDSWWLPFMFFKKELKIRRSHHH